MSNKVELEFLDELDNDLMVARRANRSGVWVDIFRDFLTNEHKYVVISFKNTKERTTCVNSLRRFKQKYNLDFTFGNYGPGVRLYIAKS